MSEKEKSELLKPGEAVVIRQEPIIVIREEPLNLVQKIFFKNEERPTKDRWICVRYRGAFFFGLLYQQEYTNMFNEVVPEQATGSEGCELLWKNIDYWCYMKDVENILKTIMKQENCDGVD